MCLYFVLQEKTMYQDAFCEAEWGQLEVSSNFGRLQRELRVASAFVKSQCNYDYFPSSWQKCLCPLPILHLQYKDQYE